VITPQPEHDNPTVWSLEALRGLAAWMVVYTHYASFAGIDIALLRFAYTGVDLFFVLSGFLFAPYLLGRPLALVEFGIRRVFRIYPAYLVALALYVGMKAAGGLPTPYLWEHLVFAHVQSREMTFFYNPAFWSLPAEVEFYLLLPLMARLTGGRVWRFGLLTALALAMRMALGYAADTSLQNTAYLAMHHLPGMLVEFLLGGVAWQISKNCKTNRTPLFLFFLGVVGWLLLADIFARLGDQGIDATWARNQISWLAALSFSLLLPATALLPQAKPQPFMQLFVWAGRLSYGTYLLHFAALQLARTCLPAAPPLGVAMVACVVTLGGAWLLYRLWESPWRAFGLALARQVSARRARLGHCLPVKH